MRTTPRFLLLIAGGLALVGCAGRSTRDIEKLLADLTSGSPKAQARAVRSLTEHGRAVVKPLSSILTGKDIEKTVEEYQIRKDWKELRVPAAHALRIIADKASLARSEAETAAAPLLEVLQGNVRDLRIEAARALGYFTQLSEPANDLILLLREDDQELVDAATEALARNALRSVYRLVLPEEPPAAAAEKDWSRLLERIRSTDDDIRLETVRELAASRDPRAAPLLLDRVAQDTSRDVRYAALTHCVEAAKADKPEGFADKLHAQVPTSFAKDDDSRVVLLAAKLLRGRAPDRVGKFLARVEAATTRCEEKLLADAGNSVYDAATRADAINALALLPGDRRDELLARLLDPAANERARIKRAAAGVLATSESPKAIAALEKAMRDPDRIVKLVAAQALGRAGNLDAVTYLVDLLSDQEAKIRTPAADALGTLGANALPVLVKQLQGSLAKAGELAKAEVPLRELRLKKELTAQERAEVAKLTTSLEQLKRAAGRDEKYVSWGIVTGLGRIASQIGAEAAPALGVVVQAAGCHYEDVRRVAVDALGSFEGEKAVRALGKAITDPDETVRWYAASALEKHGASARPVLLTALDDQAIAPAAAISLGRIGDADTLKALLARLDATEGDAKAAMVWAVGALLKRYPEDAQAPAARRALEAAAKLKDAPEAARRARYALIKAGKRPQ